MDWINTSDPSNRELLNLRAEANARMPKNQCLYNEAVPAQRSGSSAERDNAEAVPARRGTDYLDNKTANLHNKINNLDMRTVEISKRTY